MPHTFDTLWFVQQTKFFPELIDPTCQGALIALRESHGDSFHPPLFTNPASDSRRRNLTIRASYDGGQTWPASYSIFDGFSGYSGIVEMENDMVGIFFEKGFQVEELSFSRLPLDQVLSQ